MADVTLPSRDAGEGRGQLFLITALAIAVLLVSLALILNTAIYTENIATRTTDTQLDEATSAQRVAVDTGGVILDAENRRGGSPSDIESRFETTLANWSSSAATLEATNGFTTNVSYTGTNTTGLRVHQDDASRDFTDNSSKVEWVVIEDGRVRGIRFNVSRTSLDSTPSDAFRLEIDNNDGGTNDDVRVTMHDDGTNVVVTVENETGVVGSCAVEPTNDGSLVVDVSDATVGTQYCPPLETAHDEVDGEIDLEFDNADNATGTYELYATNDDTNLFDLFDGDEYATVGSGYWPVQQDAIYDANVTFVFQSSGTTVKKEIRIAPGEL
ncbi:hypothetical protein GJR96_14670 [Haloferax sp. MBLA0076]|uniref:Uncharacterized protein n=1 Tax=Haloferax litoreum TaxID=2666140 RepID=A0A6A8GJ71_9EURY|nr:MULTISPECIES: hypothetical protein [Haloferax]KAB1194618.1 hypothetical protein Hfx1148_14600 [Haloferax sp. CBA1148]MRX23195.1 hypothetical protein [Haloferax litoreum]